MSNVETRIIVSARDMATATLKQVERSVKGITDRVFSLQSTMLAAGGGLLVRDFLNTASATDRLRIALDQLSDGQGAEVFERLNDWARDLPVNTEQAIQQYISLKAMGLDPTLEQMTAILDTSLALGGGADAFEGISRALGQIQTKGKVSAEELMQLAERGVPAYQILAEKLHLTKEQVANIGNEGVDAHRAVMALLEGMAERYGGMSEKMESKWGGLVERGIAMFRDFERQVADTSAMSTLEKEFDSFLGYLDENEQQINDWAHALGEGIKGAVHGVHDQVVSLNNGLSGINTLYQSLPDAVTGPAGVGLVGRILFGSWKAATVLAVLGAIDNGMSALTRLGLADMSAGSMLDSYSRAVGNFSQGFEVLPGMLSGERDFWSGRLKSKEERDALNRSPFEEWLFGEVTDDGLGRVDPVFTRGVTWQGANWYQAGAGKAGDTQSGGSNGGDGGVDIDLKTIKAVNKELKAAFKDYATGIETVRDEYARLTMNEEELARYTFEDKYRKLAEVLGEANPELEAYAELQRQILDALTTTPEQDRLLEIAENRRGAFDLLHEVDADAVRLAQAEALAGSKERDLQLISQFSEKYRATVLGDSGYAMAQIEAQAEAYRQAGADEVAVAQWAAEEKLAASRDWTDGAQRALDEYADSATNAAANMANVVGGAFQGMEDALVEFATTGKIQFNDLADSIIADMARVAVRQSVTGPMAGWFSGLMPFAKGGAFTNSIVTSPTVFPFASGIGLMGEAGPEAILPLTRTTSGDLGVKAASGGGQGISIAIHNESGQEMRVADARVTQSGQRQMVEIWIDALERNVGGLRTILGG